MERREKTNLAKEHLVDIGEYRAAHNDEIFRRVMERMSEKTDGSEFEANGIGSAI